MRTCLIAILFILATVMTAAPALGHGPTLAIGPRHVDFGTVTAPESGTTSDAISITNVSDEPIALHLAITITKPKDWNEPFSPFIVEDAVTPNWDPCNEIAPGATCLVYLTFQTDRAGTFSGWLWINDTYRVALRGRAT
ncbi:MAG: hypothetical protein ABIP77_07820 [Candidatus Limnocylindrales bacterium]